VSGGLAPRFVAAQCAIAWSAPRELVSTDGRPVYIEAPISWHAQKAVMLLGTPSFLWATRASFLSPLGTGLGDAPFSSQLLGARPWLWNSTGAVEPQRLNFPLGRHGAVLERDGVVHLIWQGPLTGVPDSTDNTVWYSQFHDGRWDTPQSIFDAQRLDWTGRAPAIAVDAAGDVHVAVAYARGSGGGIAYLHREGEKWHTALLRAPSLPSQLTAVIVGDTTLLVMFAGVGDAQRPGISGQHVYVMRKNLRDSAWHRPERVQWSGMDNLNELRLYKATVVPSESVLLAVWGHVSKENSGRADKILTLLSRDNGATWVPADSVVLASRADNLAQLQDSAGDVHVVVKAPPGTADGTRVTYHMSWKQGAWSAPDEVPTGRVSSGPVLVESPEAAIAIVWGVARTATRFAADAAPVSMFSLFARHCAL